MEMTRMKVSFIDKETMKAVDPDTVYVEATSDGVLQAWIEAEDFGEDDIEVEIKLIGYEK